jgi:hypothetical protein
MKEMGNSVLIAVGLSLFTISATFSVVNALHINEGRIQVVSKERLLKIQSDGDGNTYSRQEYWVTASDDLYRVQDSFLQWHFHSGRVYASIVEGAKCNVTLQGYRIGFLSMFQNIIAADCTP